MRDLGGGGHRRKKPAYPKPGTGEDFPARRPGTRVGETSSGQKVMQSTRATQRRRHQRSLERLNRGGIYMLIPSPPRKKASSFKVEVGPSRYVEGRMTKEPTSVDNLPIARRIRGRRV